LSILARSLGRVMPVWYGLCLALLALESFLHRHEAALVPLLTATLIWTGVIVFTISMLVPINHRIASLNTAAPAPGWKRDHKKWDSLHQVRILLLAVALLPSPMRWSPEFGHVPNLLEGRRSGSWGEDDGVLRISTG
jgi:hypothetical protein